MIGGEIDIIIVQSLMTAEIVLKGSRVPPQRHYGQLSGMNSRRI